MRLMGAEDAFVIAVRMYICLLGRWERWEKVVAKWEAVWVSGSAACGERFVGDRNKVGCHE